MRSPLAYPLNRSADMDGGGAADLQTDIMRFMAILSLCLVAIFALVQSIPLTPTPPAPTPTPTPQIAEPAAIPRAEPPIAAPAPPVRTVQTETVQTQAAVPEPEQITLTRPKWVPKTAAVTTAPAPAASPELQPPPVIAPEPIGFTLRFESDAALMRAIAAGQVRLYAISGSRAQRMAVSESRISFWDASTPNTFHEMEAATVPPAVVDAHQRSGAASEAVNWGVTLPGKLKSQLDALMQAHTGGSLIISADANIHWEAT
ncbi:MAG: hypothetical protein OEN20_04440 [Gammaproteobacteria bacterium]|nr:hypothetical protein [Gammaproteobacteria bacterium]